MADGLAHRSALAGRRQTGRRGPPGIRLAERVGRDIVSVAARRGRGETVGEAIRLAYGIDLPGTPRRVDCGGLAWLWAGRARWTVMGTVGEPDLETALRHCLGDLASVTGLGSGRVILDISGPSARDLLAKAMAIDLHPRAFGPGDVALAPAFGIATQFSQRDAVPSYDLSIPSSTAASLWAWLLAAGAEYGVEIVD